jgi:hypothetical protein
VHSELARFVVARRQNATAACTADAYWLTAQRRSITHLDRRVKAIHIEVNDGARLGIFLHGGNLAMEQRILTFPGSIDRGVVIIDEQYAKEVLMDADVYKPPDSQRIL